MKERLFNAYDEYVVERVRAGVIDHSFDIAILEGKSVEEHIVEVLRAAGRLPEGWDDASDSDDLIPVESLDDIPPFANEDEEAEFWATHGLGGAALESLG